MSQGGGVGRAILAGAALGFVVVVAVAVAAWVVFGPGLDGGAAAEAPDEVLVVALSEDLDGATVAGMVWMQSADGEVEPLDPFEQVEIEGTSYDRLRDAYAFGGGNGVVAAASDAGLVAPNTPWVVLPLDLWTDVVDASGGVEVELAEGVNAFLGNSLYVLDAGTSARSGDEIAALVAATVPDEEGDAPSIPSADMSQAVGEALLSRWDDVVDAVAAGSTTSSLQVEELETVPAR